MSLPPFLTRVQNAAGPLLGGLSESALGERLRDTSLVLEIDTDAAEDPGHRAGYLLATNLAARLYPRLGLDATDELTVAARKLALSVNPGCAFGPPRGRALVLSWRGGEPSADRVTVSAENWNVIIDGTMSAQPGASPLAAMAAAALGTGELFRALFADRLPQGRTDSAPFAISLLTLDKPSEAPPVPLEVARHRPPRWLRRGRTGLRGGPSSAPGNRHARSRQP